MLGFVSLIVSLPQHVHSKLKATGYIAPGIVSYWQISAASCSGMLGKNIYIKEKEAREPHENNIYTGCAVIIPLRVEWT